MTFIKSLPIYKTPRYHTQAITVTFARAAALGGIVRRLRTAQEQKNPFVLIVLVFLALAGFAGWVTSADDNVGAIHESPVRDIGALAR